ncbi:MAG: beta-N-acetylglucosaminidase domain-containing protein [Polyangiales bacterium]
MTRRSLGLPALVGFAVSLAGPGASAATDAPDVVRFASLEVSRWSDPQVGYDELASGPGAIRDDDPDTAWEARADTRGDAWLLLDWASSSPKPFALDELVVAIDPADAALSLDLGVDRTALAHVEATVERAADGAHLRVPDAPMRALRLHVAPGARVASLSVRARAIAAGRAPTATGTCDVDGVHLAIDAPGSVGLRITRRDEAGRSVEILRRETAAARFDDPSVRFRPRPATYNYEIASVLPSGQTTVSVTCTGDPAKGPTTTALHGVVEGFYGRPWPFRDRGKVVRAMAALGLDPYVYAPKEAPKHRAKWRALYDDAELAEFRALSKTAEASSVRVVYAISPGLDVDAASSADRDALVAKVAQLRDGAGVRDAALLMDDITAAPSTALGAAHAALANALLASMRAKEPSAQLLFVPTVYAGAPAKLGSAERDYLAALSALPPDVPLAWTGTAVFSPSFDRAELDAFAALSSHTAETAWVWDNYPVNDALASGRLYVRPVEGRTSLYDRTGGIVANAMRHPIASIAALASFGSLARDATKPPVDPASLVLSLMDDGPPPAALAVLLDELVTHPYLHPDDLASPALVAAIGRGGLDLATRLARLALVDVDLRRELHDASLADELDGYARVTAVSALAALAAMNDPRSTESACLSAAIAQLSWQTIQRAIAPMIPAVDLAACPELDDPFDPVAPTPIAFGRESQLDASDLAAGGDVAWSVVGPDGATIDRTGHVAFTPARRGRYRLVAIAVSASGQAKTRVFDVVAGDLVPQTSEEKGCHCGVTPGATTSANVLVVLAVLGVLSRRRPSRADRARGGPTRAARRDGTTSPRRRSAR